MIRFFIALSTFSFLTIGQLSATPDYFKECVQDGKDVGQTHTKRLQACFACCNEYYQTNHDSNTLNHCQKNCRTELEAEATFKKFDFEREVSAILEDLGLQTVKNQ